MASVSETVQPDLVALKAQNNEKSPSRCKPVPKTVGVRAGDFYILDEHSTMGVALLG